jgi:peptidylprolyl isomerase
MSRLLAGLGLLAALMLAGCGPTEKVKEETAEPQDGPKPVARKPYEAKPGETVIAFTFRTQSDPVRGNGTIYIKLFTDDAPETCDHIIKLVRHDFYSGIVVNRVELRKDSELVQFGDGTTKGPGSPEGSGKTVPLEVNKNMHVPGAVGLARTEDPNSGDSQMYITFVARPDLDDGYTVFGTVVQGMDVAEGLARNDSRIVRCELVQDARPKEPSEGAPEPAGG